MIMIMAITCVHRSTGSPTKTKPGSQVPRTTEPTQCSPGIDFVHHDDALGENHDDDDDGDDDDDDDLDDDDDEDDDDVDDDDNDADQYEEQQ